MKFNVRNYLTVNDFEPIYNLLERSGFFYEYEINICMKMMEETLYDEEQDDDYIWMVAENNNDIVAFLCYGKNPLSTHSWDVYWIAVDKSYKDRGIGTILLKDCEKKILMSGGEYIWIETSGRPKYVSTHKFYQSKEYEKIAELPEYYDRGDSKIVYRKKIG